MRTDAKHQPSAAKRFFSSIWVKMVVFLVLFLVLAALVTGGAGGKVQQKQTEYLEEAVQRAAVQCYALEGSFPENLGYLEDNYGLIVDRNNFAVYYEYMGGNLLPNVRVISLDY